MFKKLEGDFGAGDSGRVSGDDQQRETLVQSETRKCAGNIVWNREHSSAVLLCQIGDHAGILFLEQNTFRNPSDPVAMEKEEVFHDAEGVGQELPVYLPGIVLVALAIGNAADGFAGNPQGVPGPEVQCPHDPYQQVHRDQCDAHRGMFQQPVEGWKQQDLQAGSAEQMAPTAVFMFGNRYLPQ